MAICSKCSAELVDGSRFCHICGTEVLGAFEVCSNCGNTLKPGSKFCGKCGATVTPNVNVCAKCGQPLKPGVRFCGKCGTPVPEEPYEEPDPDTAVCPKCGALVGAMDVACYACGAKLSKDSFSSVKQLELDIAKIEMEAPVDNKRGFWSTYFLGGEESYGSPTFEKKVAYIKSYPVPDTIDELIELVNLAIRNTHPEFGKRKYDQYDGVKGYTCYRDVTLSHAWLLKLQQAYDEGKRKFANDPRFPELRNLYIRRMKFLRRSPRL